MAPDIEQILSELEDLSRPITRGMLKRLSGWGRTESARFAPRFALLPTERRLDIISKMVSSAEEDFELDFMELFRVCLSDADARVRCKAIEGLWEDERPDLVYKLLSLLEKDPSAEVRAAAASSLGRFVFLAECDQLDARRGELVRRALERVIYSETEPVEVRRRAVEAIAYINDDEVRRIIDRAYADEHPLMRESAVFAMGRNADRFWAEIVLSELHSESPAMRYEAARACGEMRLMRAVPTLAYLIAQERDVEVQTMAIWALGEIGGKRARRILERLLESESPALVEAAEEALAQIDFANTSFDLMVFDLEEMDFVEETPGEALEETEDESEIEDFRREFFKYANQDEEDKHADDWPDEFFELN